MAIFIGKDAIAMGAGQSGSSGDIVVDDITDAGATGKEVLRAELPLLGRNALGLGSASTLTAGTAINNAMQVRAIQTEQIRLTNNVALIGRTTTAIDVPLIYMNAANTVAVGPTTQPMVISASATPTIRVGASNYIDRHTGNEPIRNKSEVVYSGISQVIPTSSTNLVTMLKALTATSGTLAPFFNTATDKLTVFNVGTTVTFKLNLVGTWSGLIANRSIELNFVGSTGNRLIQARNDSVVTDSISLPTFFSVDIGGNLATNGAVINIMANGATFTATQIVLIAEQIVPQV